MSQESSDETLKTYADCLRMAAEVTGVKPDAVEARVAAYLLAAAGDGPDWDALAAFTGESGDESREWYRRSVEAGTFRPDTGMVHAAWADEESGGIALCLDTMVALGLVGRTTKDSE